MFTQLDLGEALDAIHDPVVIAERQTLSIFYVNHAFATLTGYHSADLQGRLLGDVYFPTDGDLPVSPEQWKDGAATRRHGLLRTCAGENVLVEVRTSPALIGNQDCVVCVCREVQAPTNPTDDLVRWSALEHHSFNTVPLAVFTFDRQGLITQFSFTGPLNTRFPKLTPEAVVGLDLFSTNEVMRNPQLIPLLHGVLNGAPFENVLTDFQISKGHTLNVRVFGVPMSDPTGAASGGLLVVEDLSQHEHLAHQFNATEHRYRALMQAVPDLLLLIHKDGTYLDCKVSEMGTLVPPEEFIGKKVTDVGPVALREELMALIQQVTRTGQPESLVYELPYQGEPRSYEGRLIPNMPDEVLLVVRDVTEQKRSEAALCRQARLLEGIAGASTRLLSGGDFETALQEALQLIGEATGAQFVHVGALVLDPDSHDQILKLCRWWSPDLPQPFFENYPLRAATWDVDRYPEIHDTLMRGDVVSYSRSELDDSLRTLFAPLQMQSMVLAPIFTHGVFWGVIGFNDFEEPRRWRSEELTLIKAMAAGLGAAIERQRTEDRLRHEREVADTLVEAGTSLSSTLDRNEVLARLLEQVGRIVPYDAANVMLVDEGATHIVRSRGYETLGLSDEALGQITFRIEDTPFLQKMAETKEPYVCGDVWQEPNWIETPNYRSMRSWIGVPILVRNEMVGVFSLDSLTPNFYGEAHVRLVTPFARQAAIAYENADLYAQVKTQARQLAERYKEINALYWAGQSILSSLEPKEILLRLAEQITLLADATSTIICDYDPDTMTGRVQVTAYRPHVARPATDAERLTPIGLNSPALQAVITSGQSRLFAGEDVEKAFPDSPWLAGIHTAMLFPLTSKGRVTGCVLVRDSRPQAEHTESKLGQCQTLTQQATVVLEQATLFAEIQELERIKSEMIRIASHDLRGPLQRAQGFVEILNGQIEATLTPKQRHYVALTLEALSEITQITRDILSLERIEHRHRAAQEVNWSQLINDTFTSLLPEIDAKGQRVNAEVAHDLPIMRGDSVQLARAIGNLIGNAIKYTPDGGEITVRAFASKVEGRPHINIEVQDSGVGVPPDQQTELFQPFYRAQHEGVQSISGTGLGLSIVKAAVEYHHGSVYFNSQPGRGSTFGFRLPL
ncbi:GAF domain-containing protein [Aggregatilinea lenta]|uniref:GAF domain-containing protein n=1 Tax=Aggregatilinea lenta TaxID=913108 RepID=UPI000E5B4608|nr:GAF domain-containing protein [Aggregatilinea lenta]